MDKLLTQKQKAQAYRAILEPERSALEMVEFIKGMTAAEVAGVLQYAEAEKARAAELVDRIADNNPENERNYSANNNFRDAERVIKIIGLVRGNDAGELAKVTKQRDEYAEQLVAAKIKEFEQAYKEQRTKTSQQARFINQEAGEKVDYNKELNEIAKQENQFWTGLPMREVVNHFVIMAKRKSGNGKFFLTREQLVSFLKKGFLGDASQPKQKINCASGEKGFVIKRFYELFSLAASKYGHPNKKAKFIQLFMDCFDNWDEKSVKACFRPNITRESW